MKVLKTYICSPNCQNETNIFLGIDLHDEISYSTLWLDKNNQELRYHTWNSKEELDTLIHLKKNVYINISIKTFLLLAVAAAQRATAATDAVAILKQLISEKH